jgi:hypothetical protein
MASNTERTLKELRNAGFLAAVVEKWIRFGKQQESNGSRGIRRDLFGIGDVLGVLGDRTLLVQVCGDTGLTEHLEKIKGTDSLRGWLEGPREFEVWAWGKRSPRGTKLVRWRYRRFRLVMCSPDGDWLVEQFKDDHWQAYSR